MDQVKTGRLIRTMRTKLGLTQLALAEQLGVSDKAVSKWERGGGAPDISLLPLLSQALGVDTEALLRGDLEENDMTNGNMKKMRFYRCPACGNLLFSTDDADVTCCGAKLTNLVMHKPDEENALQIEHSDGEWYITAPHEMHREHYISFVAFLTGDTMIVKKQYPEWGLDVRLPYIRHGMLLVVLHEGRTVLSEHLSKGRVTCLFYFCRRLFTILHFWLYFS